MIQADEGELLECSVCSGRWEFMMCRLELLLCGTCYERLDQLDVNHPDPAWLFAAEIVRNRVAAFHEGVW